MAHTEHTTSTPTLSAADITRFWARVDKTEGCWLWRGQAAAHHPRFFVGGRTHACYRISYLLCVGPIPDGLCVCHTCDNGRCVNPAHLWLGTQLDNLRDRDRKGRTKRGDEHYARLHPERLARGRGACGAANGMHTKPQCRWQKRLTADQVREIRARFASGASKKQLARHYEVSPRAIALIVEGKRWAHIS